MTGAQGQPLPSQPISHDVLMDTYAQPGETGIDDVRRRIARGLAQAELPAQRSAWEGRFLTLQRSGFIVGGRIAAQAGTGRQATMASCFVQPLGDSIWWADSMTRPSIYTALGETAETLRLGGGVGIDFSPVRPRGAPVTRGGTRAAGVLAFLQLFDASSRALDRQGVRRASLMGVLRCDHPEVRAWAGAQAAGGLPHFNLAVAVTDAFMQAVEDDTLFDLVHAAEPGPRASPSADSPPGTAAALAPARQREDGSWVHARVPARELWGHIVRAAHAHGEPGLLFIDRINRDNNLGYCETLAASSPCGEQPLPGYGACCLGSFDLTRLVQRPFEHDAMLDLPALAAAVGTAVRMLDNALDLSAWPLPQQREQALAKRRIGLGFTGLGDALAMLGLHYDSDAARRLAAAVACCLRDRAYGASVALARERGAFPQFNANGLLRQGSFASRLPAALQEALRLDGLRHSHLLAVAPAGSVSLAFADNTSNGIEPARAWRHLRYRARREGSGLVAYEVEDHAWRLYTQRYGPLADLPPSFVNALQLAPAAHLAMAAAVAPYIDGAVAKVVRTRHDCPGDAFDALYRQAWKLGLKGVGAARAGEVTGGLTEARAGH